MPFMKGFAPVRQTLDYLNRTNLILKPYIRILAIHYNRQQETHKELKDFVIWHLPHLQYKNPNVQVLTIRELTPTPFIRVWLDSGRDLVLDVDRQSKDEIHERILRTLCKDEEDLKDEEDEVDVVKVNPANFGRECAKHCLCEVPGQVPCPSVVPLPYTWRGKYKFGHAEIDESKYL